MSMQADLARVRNYKIHVEDYRDLLNLHMEYTARVDKIINQHTSAATAYATIRALNNAFQKTINSRWKPEVIEEFCAIFDIKDFFQRVPYA